MKIVTISITAALLAVAPLAAQDPSAVEGLAKVRSSRLDSAYLLPGVNFRVYTKVMLDPPEVSFPPNWQRNYNRSEGAGRRIEDSDLVSVANEVRTGFAAIFAEAYRQGGYQVVTEAGPDVLRLRTGIINLYISAPDGLMVGRSRSYSIDAGEATMVIEARDSLTNALLGRVFDRRTAGYAGGRRTRVTNRSDFMDMFRAWASGSVRGLDELKARSPEGVPPPR
jgi:hypothetical protein